MSTCSACGAAARADAALLVCSGCAEARYCGPDCQRAHWKAHKAACKAARARLDELERTRSFISSAMHDDRLQKQPPARDDVSRVLRMLTAAQRPSTKLALVVDALERAAEPRSSKDESAIVAGGGAASVVAIMKSRGRFADVAEWGCAALQHFGHNATTSDAIVAAGGAEAAVAAVDAHATNPSVASPACGALCHMVNGSDSSVIAVLSAGGACAVAAAVRANYRKGPAALLTLHNAFNFFEAAVRPGRAAEAAASSELVAAGCIPLLVEVMRARRSDGELVSQGRIVLTIVAESSPANAAAVLAAGAAEFICELRGGGALEWIFGRGLRAGRML